MTDRFELDEAIHFRNATARHDATKAPPARTASEARRRHAIRCQRLTALSRDPTLSPFQRSYWAAMARIALQLLGELDETIRRDGPECPWGGRMSAVTCCEPGCAATVWELASVLWRAQQGGQALVRFCPEHTPPPSPPSRLEPASAAERDELAEVAVGRLLSLVPRLFGEPWDTPQMLANAHAGVLDRWLHSWRTNLWLLELNTGSREVAIARLRAAADEAELLHLLDAPPEPEPAPASESPRVESTNRGEDPPEESPGDLPSVDPLDDEQPVRESEPEPEPWIF